MSSSPSGSSVTTSPATASPPFVAIENLSKVYPNGYTALKGLSLQAKQEDFVSLIGPSGCGKSTLLKMLAGLTSISDGTISIDGMTPANAREITSFVFQDATLLPWRTVEKNVSLALELEHVTGEARKKRIAAMLALVGLSDVARRYPRQLSGGMKMRVSIARALVTTPRLLLMDEPFGALDEITRNYLNEELLRIKKEQRWTTFFVTHSVSEAVFLSNRIMIMGKNGGRIAREVEIPLEYPRTAVLRSRPEFLKLVGEVSSALREVY
jgi:NitT/TauT family transport system ATP-binding protein